MNKLPVWSLPGSMQEMTELIGLTATLALVEARGGIMLVVPKHLREDHWLIDVIGREPLSKLIQVFGGETIEIPRCAAALRLCREQEIMTLAAQGMSNAQLARRYGYTIRGMRQLRRRVETAQNSEPLMDDFFHND